MKVKMLPVVLYESGIAAFVLKYRIPDDSTMVDKAYRSVAGCTAGDIGCTIPGKGMGDQ